MNPKDIKEIKDILIVDSVNYDPINNEIIIEWTFNKCNCRFCKNRTTDSIIKDILRKIDNSYITNEQRIGDMLTVRFKT